MALSNRGTMSKNFPNFLTEWGAKYLANSYHKVDNPKGIVNLGMAENTLCEEIIKEKLNSAGSMKFETWMQYYYCNKGTASFREALADFYAERFHTAAPVDPNHLSVICGAGCGVELLAHAFMEPQDCILCLAPCYYASKADFACRGQVKTHEIQLSSKVDNQAYEVTRDILETGLKDAQEKGEKVVGILVINPNNPTGDVFTRESLQLVLNFANDHDLHVICDEVYALSVFDDSATFTSILSLTDIPNPEKTHHIWAFSKDFCLSGLRCGVLHTWNKDFASSVHHLLLSASVPSHTQEVLRGIITDKEWLDKIYFPTNLGLLRQSYEYGVDRLRKLGLRTHSSKAGFFVWANFSQVLTSATREGELALFRDLFEGGVFVVPGSVQWVEEPGWFRLTISHPLDTLKTGFDKLESIIKKQSA